VPFITLFGAVIIAAWLGGMGPALLAAAAGYLAAHSLYPQEPRFVPAELAAYAFSTLLIAALGGAMRRAVARAAASDERFRKFMENSPACVFIKDAAGRYVFMNAAAQKLVGVRDWAGKTDDELIPPEAARRVRENDERVLADDAPATFALTYPAAEGLRHFHSTKFPLRDADGSALVGSVTVDVTQQARSAEELRLVTDTMSVGVVRCSRDLRYLWANRVFAGWAGRTPEEMSGLPIEQVIGAGGLEANRRHFERVLQGERVEYQRLASFPRLGARWIHAVAVPTFGADGRADGWVGVVSDIHERKRAEEALAAAREQLQLVADSMSAAVALCSRDLRYIWVNRRCAEWLGMPHEEIVGRPMVEIIGEDNLAAIRPYIDRVLAGEQVQYERLVRYQGFGERWVRNAFSPAQGGDAWVSVISDIHERKLMEEALRDADRRKDQFLATLAHELRNPLAPIRNAVAILSKKGPLDPELTWSREVIDRQVEHMSRLIDDLLDIARIASGKLRMRKERIPLERAIDLALETSRPNINAAGHSLSVLLPSERATLEADPTRLAQVFSNLLNNAARYTEGPGRITLSAELQGGEVVVSVEDDGIGFPPEIATRLFEPFAQLTSAHERSQGGLGIGLSLVKGIVELHGGSVEARSAGPRKGSEFIVRLPLPAFAAEDEAAKVETAANAAAASGVRVLVADDNRDAADSLQRILSLYGHEVQVAYDGLAAMKLAADFRPRVAVLDIGMPGANGFQVARALREQNKGTRLIALTGWGQEGDRRRAMEAGFDYHLTKPVDPGALNDLLVDAASN
jgi:two-component system CheB/CheR fusion protein